MYETRKILIYLCVVIFCALLTDLKAQSGENCATAISLNDLSSPISSSTINQETDFFDDCLTGAPDLIYYLDVPTGELLRIGQVTNSYDSRHLVSYGGECPGETVILCDDDPDTQDVFWNNDTGTSQRVWWVQSGYGGGSGSFELAWEFTEALENDLCSGALSISCGQTLSGSTVNASAEEGLFCGTNLSTAPGVWYRTIGTGGEITAGLCSSNYDNKIGVFSGNCNDLICIVGVDDVCPFNAAQVSFLSEIGVEYYIYVTGYSDDTGEYDLTIDCDIVYEDDLAVVEILSPEDGCDLTSGETVEILLENLGTSSQNNFQVAYRLNGGTPVVETVNQTILSGGTYAHTFSTSVDLTSEESNDLMTYCMLPSDDLLFNDTLSTVVYNGSTFDGSVSDDQTVCQDEYVSFTAQGGSTYLWSNGSTFPTIAGYAAFSGDFTVTITNSIGCEDVDTVSLFVLSPPPVPGIQYSALALCPGGTVTLTATGADNYMWTSGETTESIVITAPGYYSVRSVSEDGCFSQYNSIYIGQEFEPILTNYEPGGICQGESAFLGVSSASSYLWSTGEETSGITVDPLVTTNYSVTVTTFNNCVYELTTTVVVLPDAAPGPVSNLLPQDGAVNIPLPTPLSWGAATNAGVYEIYIWPEGGSQGVNPSFIIDGLNYTVYGLQNGTTYFWRVRPMSCQEGMFSPVQSFTVAFLPDLVIDNSSIDIPATIFSGTSIEISWEVQNQGLVPTPNASIWYDYVYLSTDTELDNSDLFLGSVVRPASLGVGEAYSSSGSFNLPPCIEGEYYAIIATDGSNYLAEADNTNNRSASFLTTNISLTPRPDLNITQIIPPGVAGILQEAQDYTIGWEVTNLGEDTTICTSWYDQVFISQQPVFNPFTAQLVGSVLMEPNPLAPSDSYQATLDFTLPLNLVDTVYFYVFTDTYDCEEECLFEENNRLRSDPLRIVSIPRPDFVLSELNGPMQASNREAIDLAWEYYNEGIPYTGTLRFRAYLNTNPEFSTVGSIANYTVNDEFATNVIKDAAGTLTIPATYNGSYFLHLEVNPSNLVDEGTNFNAGNRMTIPLAVLSPDLIAENGQVNNGILPAGANLNVNWDIANGGPGDLINANVSDRLELRTAPAETGTFLTNVSGALTLLENQGATQRSTTLSIPIATPPGDYFIHIAINSNGAVTETGTLDNNTLSIPITITAPLLADLNPQSLTIPVSSIFSGDNLATEYTVRNTGASPVGLNWQDRLYLSTEPVWNPDVAVLVKTRNIAQILAPNQQYSQAFNLTVPAQLPTGDYYLYLVVDTGENVYEEDENNNILRSDVIPIIRPEPTVDVDLRPEGLTIPSIIEPGQTAFLSWQTRNIGTTATQTNSWVDRIYLSEDQSFDSGEDTAIASWNRVGGLAANGTYYSNRSFVVPSTQEGDFYLILVIDAAEQTQDTDRDNNAIVLSIGTEGEPVIVVLGPKPDLVPTIVSSFGAELVAGQPVSLIFESSNEGMGATGSATWSDRMVLAQNETLDNAPQILGSQLQQRSLVSGAAYQDTLYGTIPSMTPTGNYFLGLRNDTGNAITESDETNNVAAAYVQVRQPLPGDLVVNEVLAPPTGVSGALVNISWQVENQGDNPVQGYFEQGIYLSLDMVWDVEDVLLDTWTGQLNLGINGSTNYQQEICLSGAVDDDYFFLVRTDLLDNIIETDNANNTSSSITETAVSIPALTLGLPETVSLPLQKNLYYRLDVSPQEEGETILVSLFSDEQDAVNELYVRTGAIPSRSVFDYTFSAPFTENQSILLSEVEVGTYYIMAFGASGSDPQEIELLAEIVPFALTDVDANTGGDTGPVTVELTGTRFDPAMQVRLENTTLGTIEATQITYIGPARAFATFPLAGQPQGIYDVVARSGDGTDESRLVNAFSIVTGNQPANADLSFSCDGEAGPFTSLSFDEVEGSSPLVLNRSYPATARPNQVVPITLRYTNNGNVDVALPSLWITSQGGAPLSPDQGGLTGDPQLDLQLDFQEDNGPPDILRPGGSATITVYTKATDELKFILQ